MNFLLVISMTITANSKTWTGRAPTPIWKTSPRLIESASILELCKTGKKTAGKRPKLLEIANICQFGKKATLCPLDPGVLSAQMSVLWCATDPRQPYITPRFRQAADQFKQRFVQFRKMADVGSSDSIKIKGIADALGFSNQLQQSVQTVRRLQSDRLQKPQGGGG